MILGTNSAQSSPVLKGKAMECAGLLVEAVGKDTAGQDSLQFLSYALRSVETDADFSIDYALPACVRIAKCIKKDFVPYLPIIVGAIIAGAVQEIRFSMEDVEEDEEDEDDVEYDEESKTQTAVIKLGGGIKKRVTLNTHAVQQKDKAARLIQELSGALRGHMADYLLECLEAIFPLLFDKHSSDIRSSASLALAKLFDAYVHALSIGKQVSYGRYISLKGVLQSCLERLLECLRGENNHSSRACAAEALRDILQSCYSSGTENLDGTRTDFICSPDSELSMRASRELLDRCKESMSRHQQIEAAVRQNEGLESEDMEGVKEEFAEEEDLLVTLADILGHLLKVSQDSLMGLFDALIAPYFASLMQSNQSLQIQIIGVCILDDIVEFGKEAAFKYVPPAMQYFIQYLNTDHCVLRQSASYGIAQTVRMAPNSFSPFISTALPNMIHVLESLDNTDEDHIGTIENIIFALGIIHNTPSFQSYDWGGVTREVVAGYWLKYLPLRADETQAKLSSEMFCRSIERMDSLVLGPNYCHLQKVLQISADIFTGSDIDCDDTDSFALAYSSSLQRLGHVIRQMSQAMPPDSFRAALASLQDKQQEALLKACF